MFLIGEKYRISIRFLFLSDFALYLS